MECLKCDIKMGCVMARMNSYENARAKETSRQIDKQLIKEALEQSTEVKLLLLGAGESGKSTIVKQMKILHQNGYSTKERESHKSIVYTTILQCTQSIIRAMETMLIQYENPQHKLDAKRIKYACTRLPRVNLSEPALRDAIKRLWRDNGVQVCFQRSHEYQLCDSTKYYMENLDRICRCEYIPTDQDILRTRVKTVGIVETKFKYRSLKFTLIDVGGQRSERRKWLHCFQDITALIFCVALSEYNLKMAEDTRTNRMYESLGLFQTISNNRYFENSSIILFLNKTDLFREKIEKYPLTVCFDDYTGQNTYEEAASYIKERFQDQNFVHSSQTFYSHFTCATDTNNVKYVFDTVTDILTEKAIKSVGFV